MKQGGFTEWLLISFGHGMAEVLPEVSVLLGFTLLFLALGSRFFRYS